LGGDVALTRAFVLSVGARSEGEVAVVGGEEAGALLDGGAGAVFLGAVFTVDGHAAIVVGSKTYLAGAAGGFGFDFLCVGGCENVDVAARCHVDIVIGEDVASTDGGVTATLGGDIAATQVAAQLGGGVLFAVLCSGTLAIADAAATER